MHHEATAFPKQGDKNIAICVNRVETRPHRLRSSNISFHRDHKQTNHCMRFVPTLGPAMPSEPGNPRPPGAPCEWEKRDQVSQEKVCSVNAICLDYCGQVKYIF